MLSGSLSPYCTSYKTSNVKKKRYWHSTADITSYQHTLRTAMLKPQTPVIQGLLPHSFPPRRPKKHTPLSRQLPRSEQIPQLAPVLSGFCGGSQLQGPASIPLEHVGRPEERRQRLYARRVRSVTTIERARAGQTVRRKLLLRRSRPHCLHRRIHQGTRQIGAAGQQSV